MKNPPRLARLLVLLALASAATLQADEMAERNAETFERVWSIIADTHFDPDINGVDWQAVRDELAPRARAASSPGELRRVLEEMIGRLGQSHFNIISGGGWSEAVPDAASTLPEGCTARAYRGLVGALREPPSGDAHAGLQLRLIDGELVVLKVADESAADERRVRPGWRVLRIGDVSIDDHLPCLTGFPVAATRDQIEGSWLAAMNAGAHGTLVEYTVETGNGRSKTLTLERRTPPGEVVAYGNLPPARTHFDLDWLSSPAGRRIARVEFNIWMLPIAGAFERAMNEMRQADGIVIDLRGNPGGVAAIAQGVASHFFTERVSLGTLKSRRNALELRVFPRTVSRTGESVQPYGGPLAILIDRGSASTSEVFAAGLRDLGRARLFGEPSAGAALPALLDELPNGDIFLHATMDYIRPNGTRVEGARIEPDVAVVTTRRDLLINRDPTLGAAISWIDGS